MNAYQITNSEIKKSEHKVIIILGCGTGNEIKENPDRY